MGLLRWRWAAVAAGTAVLASLPALVGALPAGGSDATAAHLRDRVRASAAVGWSGYAESRAGLALPDVKDLGDLPALLGGTTRTRAWWRGPADWRVDALALAAENDVSRAGETTTTWSSADGTASVLAGELPVRLPRAADLLAPVLGRRLAATPGAVLTRLPSRRVAGRSAAGLRVAPRDRAATTVDAVDLWADPATGLPLRVEVRAQGQPAPVLTSVVLDLDLHRPAAARTAATVPPDVVPDTSRAPDVAAAIDRFAPYLLPSTLAGAARQDPARLGATGVGTYGAGFEAYAVVPLPGDIARRVSDAAASDGSIRTPLVNGLIGFGGRRSYLLVGTVPVPVLQRALAALKAAPPRRAPGR